MPQLQNISPDQGVKIELPCFILPHCQDDRIFHGREHVLYAMNDALLPKWTHPQSEREIRQFALCGLGGVGKTELALEFALRNLRIFDAVFWVPADGPAKLDESFQEISLKLQLETAIAPQNQLVSRSLVKSWLKNPIKRGYGLSNDPSSSASHNNKASWLIIFDNADDPKVLADYWPEGTGSVLITSRDPSAKRLYSTRPSGINLEPMSDAEGGALLLKLTEAKDRGEENAEVTAQYISRNLSGLPLGISQMAGFIYQQKVTLRQFVSMYENASDRLALYSTKFDTSAYAYRYNIATVWSLEKLTPDVKLLVKIISCLDSDNINKLILMDATPEISSDRLTEACTELSQSSLTKIGKDEDLSTIFLISVHRLVQEAIRATMSNEELRMVVELLINTIWDNCLTAMGAPTKPSNALKYRRRTVKYYKKNNISRVDKCANYYPHIVPLKQLWPYVTEPSETARIRFAALLNDAAWFHSERGRTRDYEGFWELSEAICRSTPGDDSNAVLADIHFRVGCNAAITNNHELSRRRKEEFFALQTSICESIAPDFVDARLGLAYAELGVAYTQDGRLDEAIEAYRRERVIRDELKLRIPLSRDASLALLHMMRGELDLAEAVLQHKRKLAKKMDFIKNDDAITKKDRRTARIKHALGNLRFLQGRFDEAYQLHKESLELFITTSGMHNFPTAGARHKLAEHLIRMGKYEEATEMVDTALQTWNYDAEIYKPELARTTFLKARLLEHMGKTQEADVTYEAAARLRAALVPQDNRHVKELDSSDFDNLVMFWSR
ncbi:P-loop containing nucleoside triphosphate hydrolase protein [Xylaria telfairii]|nr:P-loop containing nucleoside triphosphate hydrolase protein [Xylaria telfairii]